MRGHNIVETEQSIKVENNIRAIRNSTTKIPVKVNIKSLMSRVREEEKKQKKENLIYFGCISFVVVATGVIASL